MGARAQVGGVYINKDVGTRPECDIAAGPAMRRRLAPWPLPRLPVGRSEELDEIAGRIDEEDLRTAGPRHDLVARTKPGGAQTSNFRGSIVDNELHAWLVENETASSTSSTR
jgi:hypothetical protein